MTFVRKHDNQDKVWQNMKTEKTWQLQQKIIVWQNLTSGIKHEFESHDICDKIWQVSQSITRVTKWDKCDKTWHMWQKVTSVKTWKAWPNMTSVIKCDMCDQTRQVWQNVTNVPECDHVTVVTSVTNLKKL